jgi:hypothetical protein
MPDARGLEAALASEGLDCVVEARDRLAVLVPRGGEAWERLGEAPRRRGLHQLATRFGFTHVALEIGRQGGRDVDAGEDRVHGRDAHGRGA